MNGKFHEEKLGNSEILKNQSIELKSRSIEILPEVDRLKFPRTNFCRRALEHPIRGFSMTKTISPSDFRRRTHWFHDLGCL
jgi:hypothetical protein